MYQLNTKNQIPEMVVDEQRSIHMICEVECERHYVSALRAPPANYMALNA